LGTDDLFKKRRNAVSLTRKKFNKGKKRDLVLIVAEGEKTEPLYFSGFKLSNVTIDGCGFNCDSLVRRAIRLKNKAIRDANPYDQVWCVFDRDSCQPENFRNAFDLAKMNGINIAYTNEAFELWYLLHFHFYDSALSRGQYEEKLTNLLGFKYEKNNPQMYDRLISLQPEAIRNANTLYGRYNPLDPERCNPSTTVHHLVQYLNQW
jgi:hypothetical protein